MKNNWKNIFLFWMILLITISILFIIQTSFWPNILSKYNLVPQLTLPVIIYFFSQKDLFSSLLFSLFVGWISHSFSVTPLPHLLINYFIICTITHFSYKFYFGNKKNLFFILLFVGSFIFPILAQNLLNLNRTNFYFSINFTSTFLNSLITLFFGFLFYPFLQKYIKERTRF